MAPIDDTWQALEISTNAFEYVLSESWGRFYRAGVTHEQDLYVVVGFTAPKADTMGLLSPYSHKD